jgi:hypothetical protein
MTPNPDYIDLDPLDALLSYLDDAERAQLDDATIAAAAPHAAMLEIALTALHRLLPYNILFDLMTSQFDNTCDTANDPDFADDDYLNPTPPMPPQMP